MTQREAVHSPLIGPLERTKKWVWEANASLTKHRPEKNRTLTNKTGSEHLFTASRGVENVPPAWPRKGSSPALKNISTARHPQKPLLRLTISSKWLLGARHLRELKKPSLFTPPVTPHLHPSHHRKGRYNLKQGPVSPCHASLPWRLCHRPLNGKPDLTESSVLKADFQPTALPWVSSYLHKKPNITIWH